MKFLLLFQYYPPVALFRVLKLYQRWQASSPELPDRQFQKVWGYVLLLLLTYSNDKWEKYIDLIVSQNYNFLTLFKGFLKIFFILNIYTNTIANIHFLEHNYDKY